MFLILNNLYCCNRRVVHKSVVTALVSGNRTRDESALGRLCGHCSHSTRFVEGSQMVDFVKVTFNVYVEKSLEVMECCLRRPYIVVGHVV